jgi:hypothetical protein
VGDKVFGGTGNLGHLFVYDTITGQSTDLGEAIPGFSTVTSLVVVPGGLVYGATGSYGLDAHLFYFDPETPWNVSDLGVLIPGVTELGALTVGSDGKLYGGAAEAGIVFRYGLGFGDVRTWNLGGLGLQGIDSLVAGAPDGKLYGGAYSGYGNGRFFSLNPVTDQAQDLGAPVPGDSSIDTVVLAPDGKIYGGTSWMHGYLFSYDRSLGTFQIYGAPVWRDTEILDLIVASDGRLYGGSGWKHGRLFRFDPLDHAMISPGTASSLAVSPKLQYKTWVPGTPEVMALAVAGNGSVYASGYGTNGIAHLARWDPASQTMHDLGVPPYAPQVVHTLLAGADGLIYGGGGSWGGIPTLFSYDSWTGAFTYLPLDMPLNDYVYALAQCRNGVIYGGTGGGAPNYPQLFSYNPATGAFSYFGITVPGEDAVEAVLCAPDGKVYGGTGPGAHLFRLEPEAKTIVDLGQPVPDETDIWALAWGPDGRIYGGTEGRGTLFAHDPRTGTSVVVGQPSAQDAGVYDLVAGADGLIYGVTGYTEGHLFSYDPAAELLLDRGKASLGDANAYSVAASLDASEIYVGTGYTYGDFVVYDAGYRFAWLGLDYAADLPGGTDVAIDVLDLAGNVLLADASPGTSLLGLPPVLGVQLRATLTTVEPSSSPALREWSITWTDDPKLALTPGSLSFVVPLGSPDPASQPLSVTNQSGGELPWSVDGLPDWLSLEPPGGEAPTAVTVTASVEGLPAGIYTATLAFAGPPKCINCPLDLPVSLTVIDTPLLEVTPSALAFSVMEGETEVQTATLAIANIGAGVLTWTVTAGAPWLTAVPGQGTAPPDAEVVISVDPAGLAAGSYAAALTVAGPPECPNCPQSIPVHLAVVRRVYLPMVLKGSGR